MKNNSQGVIFQISVRWEILKDVSPDKYFNFSKPFGIYIWTYRGKLSVLLLGSPPSLKQLYQGQGCWAIVVLKRLKLMIVKLRIWPACSASRQHLCSWLTSLCGKGNAVMKKFRGEKWAKPQLIKKLLSHSKPQVLAI